MSEEMNVSMPQPRTSTLAIVSLIAGIAGWTFFPLLGSLVAVITGHLAKKEINESAGMIDGSGFATAGLILGYLSLGLGLCICLIVLAILLFLIPISVSSSYSLLAVSALFA